MREKILAVIEKNSRIDIKDLAILLGESEAAVANEIAEMEKEHIICGYHTLINWDNTSDEKVVALIGDASLAGGIGTALNTYLGALIIGWIRNILNLMGVASYPQMIIKGIIIILAVLSQGLVGGTIAPGLFKSRSAKRK